MFKNIIFDLCGVLFEDTRHLNRRFSPINEGIEVLRACSKASDQKNYRLFACTNMSEASAQQLKNEHPEIMKLFLDVVTSERAGAKKPDLRIFSFLCTLHDLNPQESVYIDDCQENVHAATTFGMYGIWAPDGNRLKKELASLGLISF